MPTAKERLKRRQYIDEEGHERTEICEPEKLECVCGNCCFCYLSLTNFISNLVRSLLFFLDLSRKDEKQRLTCIWQYSYSTNDQFLQYSYFLHLLENVLSALHIR